MNTSPVTKAWKKVSDLYTSGAFGRPSDLIDPQNDPSLTTAKYFDLVTEAKNGVGGVENVFAEFQDPENQAVKDEVKKARKAIDAVAAKIQKVKDTPKDSPREAVKALVKACRESLENLNAQDETANQGAIEGSTEIGGGDITG